MRRKGLIIALFLSSLFVSSCQREEAPQSGPVGFAVMESIPDLGTKAETAPWSTQAGDYTLTASEQWLPLSGADTKASKIYRSADSTPLQGDPIAVWAYNMPAAGSAVSAWLVDGGSPSPVQASYSSGKWVSNVNFNTSRRAASYYTRWFAVAPWAAIGGGATVSTLADGQAPVLSYTVPSAVSGQHDLMVATPTAARAIDDKSDIPLSFQHVLTGIRIKAPKAASVTAVTLSGVYDRATLSLNASELEWTSLTKSSATPSFTADVSSASVWDTSDTEYQFLKEGGIFLMLPQWLPAGAKIAITVDDTTVEADLSGHEWKMGKLVTYRVARETREYHIEVEVTAELPVSGASATVATINSYSTPEGGGAQTSASWQVKGVYSTHALALAGGTPDLTGWSASSSGSSLQVTPASPSTVSKTVNALLQEAPEWGTVQSYWNLANRINGSARIIESANTYIINAPGYYRIPMVVGNGIKGGEANPSAYPSGFVDYKGEAIQSPYLQQSGTPSTGAVVWTETTGMVENLTVVSDAENDLYWIKFRIQSSHIAQGCTVVSVKDGSGTVMWSWLLWVTDYEPGVGDVACNYTSSDKVTFMPRNLGWTVDGTLPDTTPAAVGFVRVESVDDPSTYAVVRVRRAAGSPSSLPHAGHGPYFQWGRKDAMAPTSNGWAYLNGGTARPEDLIKNPGHHFVQNNSNSYPYTTAGGFIGKAWWSASATSNGQDLPTVKTVYDPCPAGYTVPRHDAFNGFSIAQSTWDATNVGYAFNTAYQSAGTGTIYFPAVGRRQAGATSAGVTSPAYGQYWVAVPQGDGTSRRLSFWNGGITLPRNYNPNSDEAGFFNKAGEHSIRPAVEE